TSILNGLRLFARVYLSPLFIILTSLRKDVQGIIHTLKTDFLELQIKEYYGKSNPVEKARDFSN
ncbi:11084_t:CDS:2, partial [Funneliformis geosporum]